ncbi:polysaccharide biosynthesis/export family protein [Novosphingobium album (ex Liu et al. 2023)]|uniref:SLBB domain-containing protein n=1 Tax=Novosphingobium album (ex Liu et al. 2023) TaxID=3031130 RepID=A0ABT5WQM5_9SPHN|nr:SLBB domain-containing protein [Novosphingobium album (ex Liu et al. 2023)]MDE8652342.1 SLBB domain-containing protein [Novosphingobium album (ex Liu et al. 2023)]
MNSYSRHLAAGLALAALLPAAPALAQLSLPVVPAQQQGGGGFGNASAGQAVPPAQAAPFEPADLDTNPPSQPQAETAEQAPAEETKLTGLNAPSEFESFVSTIAGKPLRRFGAELLVPGTRDFSAPPTATIPPDYRLNPGDQIRLALAGSVQATNLRLTIDSEGRVFVPRVGAIMLGGVRYGDVREVVAREVSRQYRSFEIEVTVARLKGVTVFVTGFAARPGSFSVGSLATLVNAVLAAGGPAPGGSFRSIQLRRGGRLVSDFDLYDLLLKGDRTGDMVLQNGDVIYIAPAGEQVAVMGSVNHEAVFELAPGETLADALLYAGGVNTIADRSRLMVLDSLGAADAGWRELSAAEAQATPARRGDVIRVLTNAGIARPLQQQSLLVTISGEVARPGRYFFKPGTRLADVVAEAGGLTTEAFPYASVITRESVKQQQRASFERAVADVETVLTAQPLTSVNRSQLIQPANVAMIQSVVEQMRKREPTGRLVFDLPVETASLPGELILENNDTIYVPPRPVTVGVFGAVPSPASFAYSDGRRIRDFVKMAGGIQNLGDKAEIFVVRANGTVIADGRRTLNARALPGDLVFVPIDADRGEFWARLRDITGTLFGGIVGAASVKAIAQ